MAIIPCWPVLSNASTGANVAALQCLLFYYRYNIDSNGIFDVATQAAVTLFQRSSGLTDDGMAGQDTLSAMIVTIANRTNNSAARAAQHLLNKFEPLCVDGDFGVDSETATRTFQQKMGMSCTGIVDALTWRYLFGYNTYPNSADTTSGTIKVKNIDYAGNSILSSSQLSRLQSNYTFYKKAQDTYGVPWQILAALHYREYSLVKGGPINRNGPYQIWGSNYPVGAYTDEQFQTATNIAAQFVLDKMGNIRLSTDDNVKLAFFRYNGISSMYITQGINLGFTTAQANNGEGSPYVMNRYDKLRDPTVEPTKSTKTWGQIKVDNGPIEYPANSDYGAFVIYKVLC